MYILAIKNYLPFLKDFFELVGLAVLTIGSLYKLFDYLFSLIFHKNNALVRYNKLKIGLGRYIALSLEFSVIADLISTSISINYEKLGMLLLLVIIRTIIGYFLNKDLENVRS